jgi:tRNA(His) guanylyltransferase
MRGATALRQAAPGIDAVADLHKSFERTHATTLPPEQPVLVRLDGHRFSSFTKGFHKPYDMRIFVAMQRASADLLQQLGPSAVYTQSDEITLCWPSADTARGQAHPFAGKTQKMASLAAALASVRFGAHLRALLTAPQDAELRDKCDWAHFDGRAFAVPGAAQVLENVTWRQADVRRNSVNGLGALFFTARALAGRSPVQVREMLLTGPGVDWADTHPHYRLGALLKKQSFMRPFVHPRSGESGVISRSRVAMAHRLLGEPGDEALLLATRAESDDPFFVPLEEEAAEGAVVARVAAVAVAGVELGPQSRLARHCAACGVQRTETVGPGVLALCGSEEQTRSAVAAGSASVVWSGGPRVLPADLSGKVVSVPSLAWLLPERVGLPSYESHDEGLAEWHKRKRN